MRIPCGSRTTPQSVLVLALVLALAPRPSRAAPALAPAAPPPAREGHVVQATRARAYLDAGSREGLVAGASLGLRRGGAPIGRCTLEQVSDHRATCTGAAARPGDTFPLPEAPAAEKPAEALRAAPVAPAERARAAAALEAVEQPLAPFHATTLAPGLPGGNFRADVQLAHASYLSSGSGPWHEERLDVAARGVPLGAGLSLWLDLSARQFLRQGDAVNDANGNPISPRFRPGTKTQLYVWEAQVTREGPGLTGSLGRLNPWMAPGAPRVDGLQAGWKSESGQEFGVYGGALPDQLTLAPGFDRATAGAFWSLQRRSLEQSALPVLLHQGRVALVTTPEGGQRFEGEGAVQASLLGLFDLAGEARAGAGGALSSGLEAARAELTVRPHRRLSLGGSFRYVALVEPLYAGPGAPAGGPSRSFDANATWEAIDGLRLSGTGGGDRDLTSGLRRTWAGPEVALPRLFGSRGGLSAGWQEEWGWLAGRNLWLQAQLLPAPWLRLLARASFAQDSRSSGFDNQLGLFVSLAARVAEHVELRLNLLARMDPGTVGSDAPAAQGLVVDAAVGGMF